MLLKLDPDVLDKKSILNVKNTQITIGNKER